MRKNNERSVKFNLLTQNKGQMAIFVALLFQVLFMFFAMIINVSLAVHDKINLQNAVDLAAYYGAQKQAEMLNAIAHNNYMIRQSWKLLTFRYRVLGTMGLSNREGSVMHPVRSGQTSQKLYEMSETPRVCLQFSNVADHGTENVCKTMKRDWIPKFPKPNFGIGQFISPISFLLAKKTEKLEKSFYGTCKEYGQMNWFYAMASLTAFRRDQQNRKMVIFKLAENLTQGRSLGPGDFYDLDGNSVLAGVRKTLIKNLTAENRGATSGEEPEIEFYNSLTGIEPKSWLKHVFIQPRLAYADYPKGAGSDSCNLEFKSGTDDLPNNGFSALIKTFGQSYIQGLKGMAQLNGFGEPSPTANPMEHNSLGVEKNPWYMIYVGVKARTHPRQIFFPFGPTISFEAKAFAKPFGGRIGPWHGKTWPANDEYSNGSATKDRVDPLVPPRAQGLMTSETDLTRLVNHGKYPGDPYGMRSNHGLSVYKNMTNVHFDMDYFQPITEPFQEGGINDILSWSPGPPIAKEPVGAPQIRNFELASLAPDLFDISYYSISPNYADHYLSRMKANRTQLGLEGIVLRGDLGSRGGKTPMNIQVKDQIKHALSFKRQSAGFWVRNPNHLLTDWVSKSVGNYEDFPDNAFANCTISTLELSPSTGSGCARGGRVGYSVKIVSKDFLRSKGHSLGNSGGTSGIKNPPPESF